MLKSFVGELVACCQRSREIYQLLSFTHNAHTHTRTHTRTHAHTLCLTGTYACLQPTSFTQTHFDSYKHTKIRSWCFLLSLSLILTCTRTHTHVTTLTDCFWHENFNFAESRKKWEMNLKNATMPLLSTAISIWVQNHPWNDDVLLHDFCYICVAWNQPPFFVSSACSANTFIVLKFQ